MIFQLDDNEIIFPDPALAEEDGLLAVGGDLRPERLLLAYQNGIFPWFSDDGPVCWYSPHERCVIFPDKIYVSRTMQKILDSKIFSITTNTAFEKIIATCKMIPRKDQSGTWITDEMKAAYIKLHELGVAHSIEVWKDGALAGGLYGIQINNIFCGESMFSRISNASKAALIWLCRSKDYSLVDCQLSNDHLMGMGAEMISRSKYEEYLKGNE